MSNDANTVHPGLILLRTLLPDAEMRRAWTMLVCANPEHMDSYIENLNIARGPISAEEKAQISAFIDSI